MKVAVAPKDACEYVTFHMDLPEKVSDEMVMCGHSMFWLGWGGAKHAHLEVREWT